MKDKLQEAAEEVHSILGHGWTESIYHRSLERELAQRGVPISSEGNITVFYKGLPVGRRRPDLFIETDEGTIVIELKAGSTSGSEQLSEYLEILDKDNNFNIIGGALIQFNEELGFSYVDTQTDDNSED